jgi:hypothetical protein
VFCFAMESPEKALDAGKHERTPLRGQRRRSRFSGLTRPSRLRGAPLMGRPKAFDCAPQIRLAQAVANNPDVSARSRSEGKRLPRRALAKARGGAGWKPAKAGVLPGKLTEPVNTLYALEAEVRKRWSLGSSPRHQASKLRSVCKAGRFCRSRENDGRQRLALKRQPPCGGRRYGCRAFWPCRRDCR